MMRRLIWVCLCACLIVIVACDDEPDRLDGPVSKGDAKDEVSERLCYEYEQCNCGELAGVSLSGCETGLGFAWQARVEDAAESGLQYDGACLTKRLNFMLDRGCDTPDIGSVPFCTGETCQIFHGTKSEGEECEGGQSTSDCEQGLVCLGTCQVPCQNVGFDIAEGETCRDTNNDFYGTCADALVCDFSDPELGTCLALPAAGQPCLANGQCAEGAFCDTQNGMNCAAQAAIGGDCLNYLQCESGNCGTDQKCAPAPGEGEACLASCADGLICAATQMGAICQKIPGKGEACLTNVVDRCVEGLTCRNGKCDDPPKEGQSCKAGEDGFPVLCAGSLVCGAKLCSQEPSAPGCDSCAPDDNTCIAQVCTKIPPAVCGDGGGLLY